MKDALQSSRPIPASRDATVTAPPGFETQAPSQMPNSLQPHGVSKHLQGAMPASRAGVKQDVLAASMAAHDATPQKPAPRVAMSLPGEAAARQLQGSSAAKTRLQERLAANEEVCLHCKVDFDEEQCM